MESQDSTIRSDSDHAFRLAGWFRSSAHHDAASDPKSFIERTLQSHHSSEVIRRLRGIAVAHRPAQ